MSQIFSYQSQQVRTVTESNETWFVAKDVCAALGIVWKGNEIVASIPEGWKGVRKLRTPRGGTQNHVVITEPAVYKLAFRSNKPEADAFTNWVASEVLPAIRKTGSFGKPKLKQACLPSPEPYLPSVQDRLDSLTREIDARLSECLSLYIQVEDLIAAATPTLSMHLGPTRLALASGLRRGSHSYLDSVRCGLEGLRHTCKALACYQA